MKINKKYFIRRNLDSYSEVEFAKFLEKRGIKVFYPFRDDVGVDILAFNEGKVEFYQLRARNEQSRYPNVYWFQIGKKDIKKLSRFPNSFFILCALQPNNKFDFFKLPIDVVKRYIKLRERTTKKSEKTFLEIKRIDERKYIIKPERISKFIDINKYLL
jgi:hypothetical protein